MGKIFLPGTSGHLSGGSSFFVSAFYRGFLFEEKEHENRIYWLKEQGGKNLLVQDLGDANCVIDELPEDYVVRGCKYHNNKLLLADGNGKNRTYIRSAHNRLFKPETRRTARIVDMYPNTSMRG